MSTIKANRIGNSGAEEKFIQLFCDVFGPERGQYVYMQYPFVDIYGGHRTIDFALNSDDGSFLSVDGVMVVDNDGYHGTEYKQQQVALEKGWHEIEIRYFDFHDGSGYFEGFVTCKDKPDEPVRFAHL